MVLGLVEGAQVGEAHGNTRYINKTTCTRIIHM